MPKRTPGYHEPRLDQELSICLGTDCQASDAKEGADLTDGGCDIVKIVGRHDCRKAPSGDLRADHCSSVEAQQHDKRQNWHPEDLKGLLGHVIHDELGCLH